MGLIGTATTKNDNNKQGNMWTCLQDFSTKKPVWGTCAGMILLADRCIGTSAVIEDGQSLIGGMNITVCRNYFGSQISSFEMPVPAPPNNNNSNNNDTTTTKTETTIPFPGVFIRAPAILSAGNDVEILGRVVATPCRQAAVTLNELERKIASGEDVIKFSVADALERNGQLRYKVLVESNNETTDDNKATKDDDPNNVLISLPGAADGTNAREVICAVRKGNLLCTAFHPELTKDYRWHEYFVQIVKESQQRTKVI